MNKRLTIKVDSEITLLELARAAESIECILKTDRTGNLIIAKKSFDVMVKLCEPNIYMPDDN